MRVWMENMGPAKENKITWVWRRKGERTLKIMLVLIMKMRFTSDKHGDNGMISVVS